MTRNVYKLKAVLEADYEDILCDFYLDVNKISSFYVPSEHPVLGEGVTLEYGTSLVTVQQEPHILEYLRENFVDVSKTPQNY